MGLFHFLWIRGDVHGQKALHLSHVLLHLFFFVRNNPLLESAAARLLRRRTDGSLLDLSIGTILATVLRRGFLIAVEGKLRCYDPLILVKLLRVLRHRLLYGSELFLKRSFLGNGGRGSHQCHRTNHQPPGTNLIDGAGERLPVMHNCKVPIHVNSPWSKSRFSIEHEFAIDAYSLYGAATTV